MAINAMTILFHVILVIFQMQFIFFNAQGNEEDIENFFRNTLSFIESIIRERDGATDFRQERLYRELDDNTRTLSALISLSRRGNDPSHGVYIHEMQTLYGYLCSILSEYETTQRSNDAPNTGLVPPTTFNRFPGRPRYSISTEQISHCVSMGMNWKRIASCFGISRRTLYRHRQYLGVQALQYSVLSNQELNQIVTDILQLTPNAGEVYVIGSLRSRGIRIQRWRVRQSLQEVDPIGRSIRRRHAIRRRIYNVQTSNELW